MESAQVAMRHRVEEVMKILIGYDGSECAEAAISELRYAGLPGQIEAEVLSVADVFPHLAPEIYRPPEPADPEDSPIVKRARALAGQALADAKQVADEGAAIVRAQFPGWSVRASATGDSPYWGVIKRADEWRPDLIVLGSHGRSAAGRLLLGSVSQKTLAHAGCSVRIGRPRLERAPGPVKVLIAMDCSPGGDAAVAAVAARQWPDRSEAVLLTVLDVTTSLAVLTLLGSSSAYDRSVDEHRLVARYLSEAAIRLRNAGLSVAPITKEGKPAAEILKEAERFDADCIFLGARGLSRMERILLGSVSAAVAACAHCSVEVVR